MDRRDTRDGARDVPPLAVPCGDKHSTDREPTLARCRRVFSWARQQAFRATQPEGAGGESSAQVAIEKPAEVASLGRWVLWNPSLTLLMLLTLPIKLYKRRQADRFDNSRRTEMVPETVAADLDLPVTPVDLSMPERYRRQSWVVTLWAWVPVAVAGGTAASLGWAWAALLGGFTVIAVGFWSHRRHCRVREAHMAGEIAELAERGPVLFFVGDSHVDPICEELNEAGVATARHPDSRYATAGEPAPDGEDTPPTDQTGESGSGDADEVEV